jgi:hypothetical protein
MRILGLSFLAVVAILPGFGSDVLNDNFANHTIDSSKWLSLTPFPQSKVIPQDGHVLLVGRGTLLSARNVGRDVRISGTITILSSLDHVNIYFRTDGQCPKGNGYAEHTGMFVSFAADSGEISIQKFLPDNKNYFLAKGHYPIATGVPLSFEINAAASNITFAINGVNQLQANETFSTGQRVAISNREFPDCRTLVGPVKMVWESLTHIRTGNASDIALRPTVPTVMVSFDNNDGKSAAADFTTADKTENDSEVRIGSTEEEVLVIKGEPLSKLAAGEKVIYNWSDVEIILDSGKVTKIRPLCKGEELNNVNNTRLNKDSYTHSEASAARANPTPQDDVAKEVARRRWEVACSRYEAAKKRENIPGKQSMSERSEIVYQIDIAAAAWEMNGNSDGFNCSEAKSLRYRQLAYEIDDAQERLRKDEDRYEHTIWTERQAPEKEEARVRMEASREYAEKREKERQDWRW